MASTAGAAALPQGALKSGGRDLLEGENDGPVVVGPLGDARENDGPLAAAEEEEEDDDW
ncbi:unnamed protein product [Sphagnum compactum]